MPWSCKACQAVVARDDVSTCPACGGSKTAWSVAAEHTRKFVLSTRKKLVALRGETFRTARGAPYRHRFTSWRETERASVLTAKRAAGLMATDEVPDAHDLLCVRMTPPKTLARWVLTLSIKFEQEKVRDLALEFEPDREALDEDGAFSAYFVCVHGPEVEALRFPFIHVLDVTEATPLGHAPLLEVSGFRSAALPIVLGELGALAGARLRSLFTLGRSFVKPSAIPQLTELARRAAKDPTITALVVGHTDSSGSDVTNQAVSLARAEAVSAFLTGDAAWFRAQFTRPAPLEPWGWEEVQWMLSAVKALDDRCYAGFVDGVLGPVTATAIRSFQLFHDLPVDGLMGEQTLAALIEAYLATLGPERPAAAQVVAHGGGAWHAPRALGAGGKPLTGPGFEDDRAVGYRRADVFLFSGPPAPALTDCPGGRHPACKAYGAWCEGIAEEIAAPDQLRVAVRLVDERLVHVRSQPVALFRRDPDGDYAEVAALTSSPAGLVLLDVPPGVYALRTSLLGDLHTVPFLVHADEVGGMTVHLPVALQPPA